MHKVDKDFKELLLLEHKAIKGLLASKEILEQQEIQELLVFQELKGDQDSKEIKDQ